MHNLAALTKSTAEILISDWCKAEHLDGYFICSIELLQYLR
jgi:hypothetical protein